MIKAKGGVLGTKLERMATFEELQALRERVTALEEASRVTPDNVTSLTALRDASRKRQKAYRERKKANA